MLVRRLFVLAAVAVAAALQTAAAAPPYPACTLDYAQPGDQAGATESTPTAAWENATPANRSTPAVALKRERFRAGKKNGIGISDVLYWSLRKATGGMVQLERSIPVPPARIRLRGAKPAPPSGPYEAHIERAARDYRLSPGLIRSVIAVESSGDARAVSSKRAKGLMQLTDSTAEMLGVRNVFDPKENIRGGACYLRQLLDRFDGDLRVALAAYNAGPGAVERHGGIPPFEETRAYVARVLEAYANQSGGKHALR